MRGQDQGPVRATRDRVNLAFTLDVLGFSLQGQSRDRTSTFRECPLRSCVDRHPPVVTFILVRMMIRWTEIENLNDHEC